MNLRYMTLSNVCFASLPANEPDWAMEAICEQFFCQEESVSFYDDDDGIEWFKVDGEIVGRIEYGRH
jgi:hypothetical protein